MQYFSEIAFIELCSEKSCCHHSSQTQLLKNHFLKKSPGQRKYNIQLWTVKLPCEPAEIKWLKQVPTGNLASWNRLVSTQLVRCRKRYAKNDDLGFRTVGPLPFFLTAVKSCGQSPFKEISSWWQNNHVTRRVNIFLTHPQLCEINKE